MTKPSGSYGFLVSDSVCTKESHLYNLFIFLNPAISWRQCQINPWEDTTSVANPSELLQILQYVVTCLSPQLTEAW